MKPTKDQFNKDYARNMNQIWVFWLNSLKLRFGIVLMSALEKEEKKMPERKIKNCEHHDSWEYFSILALSFNIRLYFTSDFAAQSFVIHTSYTKV